jgi:hypothetical protein
MHNQFSITRHTSRMTTQSGRVSLFAFPRRIQLAATILRRIAALAGVPVFGQRPLSLLDSLVFGGTRIRSWFDLVSHAGYVQTTVKLLPNI